MTYLIICCFIISTICFITSMVLTLFHITDTWDTYCMICGLLLFVLGIILLFVNAAITTPTEDDVLKGKAIYQETLHITNNDTIKTYQIVWKGE